MPTQVSTTHYPPGTEVKKLTRPASIPVDQWAPEVKTVGKDNRVSFDHDRVEVVHLVADVPHVGPAYRGRGNKPARVTVQVMAKELPGS